VGVAEVGDGPLIKTLITLAIIGALLYAAPFADVVRDLGLDGSVERFHVGFMGCYAAIPGLKLAARICENRPAAKVMVIASELCSIHFQGGNSTDELISASVFGDGAAGVIVSQKKPENRAFFEVHEFSSTITEEGSEDMAWTIGDTGFNMVLSAYIPEILSNNLNGFIDPVLKNYTLDITDIHRWAVHPGGRAILDKIEHQLQLPENRLYYSRKVLSRYGNMSSATILFVLKEILEEKEMEADQENVFVMAFGPGITIESGILIKHT
jgi:predicted naringenin-chalcone synthase